MNHVFVTCFWNSTNDPYIHIRQKLCQEFVDRYPNVVLLQNGNLIKSNNCVNFNVKQEGFIDYIMINSFIKTIKNLKSLTLIDSDLILSSDFFKLIEKCHDKFNIDFPHFVTFRSSSELIDNKVRQGPSSKIYNIMNDISPNGHTGFVLSFNKKFIDNYKFPETFIHGGFDYFLVNAVLGKCMKQFIVKFKAVPKCVYEYIESDVLHQYHGPGELRKTNWNLYSLRF